MILKLKRIKRGLTQEELSKKAGVSRITISNIENGKVDIMKIQFGILIKIAEALDSSLEELFLKCEE